MSIVSSVFALGSAQIDGRRWCFEAHTDHLGVVRRFDYLAASATDHSANLAQRAVWLVEDLAQAELSTNLAAVMTLGSTAVVVLNHSTIAQVRAALREAYQSATRTEAIMLGDFLSSLTSAQLQTLFGMTAAQVTTLRTNKLTPAATAAASIRSASGA